MQPLLILSIVLFQFLHAYSCPWLTFVTVSEDIVDSGIHVINLLYTWSREAERSSKTNKSVRYSRRTVRSHIVSKTVFRHTVGAGMLTEEFLPICLYHIKLMRGRETSRLARHCGGTPRHILVLINVLRILHVVQTVDRSPLGQNVSLQFSPTNHLKSPARQKVDFWEEFQVES